MAEVSKIITEKQDDPWNGERPGQDAKKPGKNKQTIFTYRRISKRLAVETTSLLLYMFYYSIPSLLKSKHAISITCAEMHADHIVSSGSPHNVLHFSSYYYNYIIIMVRPSPARRYRDCTGVRDIFQHELEAA